MILIDLNQIMIAGIMGGVDYKNPVFEEDYCRHVILNSLRSLRTKFKNEYGEIILCSDDKSYWRKEAFPYYKASRKTAQQKSAFDWHEIYRIIGKIKSELKTFFPYKFIQVKHAEADDVIGSICINYGEEESFFGGLDNILIVSSDKDFIQMQTYNNVKQYDVVRSRWIVDDNPKKYLFIHILKGDSSDGIPNIMSNDDSIVTKTRQKPVTQKRIQTWENGEFTEEEKKHFKRNEILIDLQKIPIIIQSNVMNEFHKPPVGKRSDLTNYFMQNNLASLFDKIGEF